MGSVNCQAESGADDLGPVVPPAARARILHRLAAARAEKGFSPRELAEELNTTVEQIQRQEQAGSDLQLSVLYQWAEALGVPVEELLVDHEAELPYLRLPQEQTVHLLRTAEAICREAKNPKTKRLAQTLVDQLIEVLPELKTALPLAAKEKRRAKPSRPPGPEPLSDSFFVNLGERD